MDNIKIPYFDVWHDEYDVYDAIAEFLRLAYKLRHWQQSNSSPAVYVLKNLMQLTRIPIPEIDVLYTALIDAAFAYTSPETGNLNSNHDCSLFTSNDRTKWDDQRLLLKQYARKHTDIMVDMMEWQEKCWKSRDKMKQYISMLECAQMSLPYYVNEERNFRARKYAIKQLKKDVKQKQRLHAQNTGEYHKLLQERDRLWKNLQRVSWELETGVRKRLKDKLKDAWNDLRQSTHPDTYLSELDMDEISCSLYSMTCRQYIVIHPPYDISSSHFNVKINRPVMNNSDYYRLQQFSSQYDAMFNYICTVIEDTGQVPTSFLKLKQGDRFILKMTSDDHTVGFGLVKTSILQMKRWGFVYISNIDVISKIQPRST